MTTIILKEAANIPEDIFVMITRTSITSTGIVAEALIRPEELTGLDIKAELLEWLPLQFADRLHIREIRLV